MSNIKFSQFANGGDLQPTDEVVGLRSGINTLFHVENLVLFTNNLFIADNGSDSTGNGSISDPYLTLTKVNTVAAANPGSNFLCHDYRLQATESSFTPQPNVRYFSTNTILSISGGGLGSNWTNIDQATIIQGYIFITSATCTFDFSAFSVNNRYQLIFNNCVFIGGGTFDFLGFTANLSISNPTRMPYIQFIDCNCSPYNVPEFNYSFREAINFNINGGNVNNITQSTSVNTAIFAIGNIYDSSIGGFITQTGTSTAGTGDGLEINLSATLQNGPPVINANQTAAYFITLQMDPLSYRSDFTVNGSGNYQIVPFGQTGGIEFPFTGTFYVSSDSGVDTPSSGSFGMPFATIAYAMAHLNGASAAVIVLGQNQVESAQITIPPFVSLIGSDPDCLVTNSLPVNFSGASFTAAAISNVFSNIKFSGSVSISLSSANPSSLIEIGLNNVWIGGTFTVDGSSGTTNLRLNNCHIFSTNFTNLNGFGNSNYYSFAFSLGSSALNRVTTTFTSVGENFGNVTVTTNTSETLPSSLIFRSANISGTVTATGILAKVFLDVVSWKTVTLASSAPAPVLLNTANGLLTNYTPSNFTPTDTSVKGAIQGLDNKIVSTANGIITAGSTATSPFVSKVLTNGQLLIGNTGNPPTATTLGAGVGILISNAPGSITISSAAVSAATSGFMYGFNGMNGPGAKQAQVTAGFEDACASADNSFVIQGPSMATNLILTINTTGVNGLDTGTAINDFRYFWFVIADSTGVNPIATLASASQSPALPAGYNQFRCIGSVKTKRASTDLVEFYYRGFTSSRAFVYLSAPNESFVLSAGNSITLTKIDMLAVTSIISQEGIYTYHFTPTTAGDQFSITQHNNTNIITRISATIPSWGQIKYSTNMNGDVDYNVDQVTNALDLYVSEFTENL